MGVMERVQRQGAEEIRQSTEMPQRAQHTFTTFFSLTLLPIIVP